MLLYLTGGLANPFSMLFLAPVMIAAVSFSGRMAFLLTALVVIAATALTFEHLPLPWYPGEQLKLPLAYSAGIWTAIVLAAAFAAIYASRVAEETRLLADALAATELVVAREQHLTQLDGLAAAAAHELGTPLATITLVVKEIQKQLPKDSSFEDDVTLLAQEAARCRSILGKIASLGNESGNILDEMTLGLLLEEAARPRAGAIRACFMDWAILSKMRSISPAAKCGSPRAGTSSRCTSPSRTMVRDLRRRFSRGSANPM
jgi:two-component system, sensor histidine kinase RegB